LGGSLEASPPATRSLGPRPSSLVPRPSSLVPRPSSLVPRPSSLVGEVWRVARSCDCPAAPDKIGRVRKVGARASSDRAIGRANVTTDTLLDSRRRLLSCNRAPTSRRPRGAEPRRVTGLSGGTGQTRHPCPNVEKHPGRRSGGGAGDRPGPPFRGRCRRRTRAAVQGRGRRSTRAAVQGAGPAIDPGRRSGGGAGEAPGPPFRARGRRSTRARPPSSPAWGARPRPCPVSRGGRLRWPRPAPSNEIGRRAASRRR
jgi:hypothetical protein